MIKWFKDRFQVIQLILQHSPLLVVLGILQVAGFIMGRVPHWAMTKPILEIEKSVPWYAWVIGWLALLCWAAVEYSLRRKERFDFTSLNFFKSYLDFITNQGGALLMQSQSPDFYAKVSEWQRQVVEGIAIGLGPEESEKFFQKMDGQFPLVEAYRKFKESGSQEALCLALEENLKELRALRQKLAGPQNQEMEVLQSGAESSGARGIKPVKQIGSSKS
jgi:hypothetical protein